MFSHRFHRTHRTFLLRYSPTDFTDLHRIFLLGYSPTDFTHRSYGAFKGVHLSQVHQHNKIYILPQNSEHILAGIFSHRFHRTHRTFLLRYSPTDFTHRSYGAFKGVHLSQVHQHNKIYILPQNSEQNILAGIFSHRFHRFTQKFLLRKLPQISQNTQNFLAEIFSHRFHRFTQNFLAEKNSVKSVDSVGDIRALTSVRICEICGSFSTANLE